MLIPMEKKGPQEDAGKETSKAQKPIERYLSTSIWAWIEDEEWEEMLEQDMFTEVLVARVEIASTVAVKLIQEPWTSATPSSGSDSTPPSVNETPKVPQAPEVPNVPVLANPLADKDEEDEDEDEDNIPITHHKRCKPSDPVGTQEAEIQVPQGVLRPHGSAEVQATSSAQKNKGLDFQRLTAPSPTATGQKDPTTTVVPKGKASAAQVAQSQDEALAVKKEIEAALEAKKKHLEAKIVEAKQKKTKAKRAASDMEASADNALLAMTKTKELFSELKRKHDDLVVSTKEVN
ncbi:hypothetical protein NE237_033012 [Protea cynaroides]|uniref:Uncharacterized protein n=1 Tax=Protea cynaroides TaxID=273540 RepID=A0A9Q0L4N5_9MAGN|nr:hypothetical protein NE237_033012 [Protea cynaroides]